MLNRLLKNKIFWLTAVSAAVRILFTLIYPYKSWPETNRYVVLAQQFLSSDYSQYTGKNVPVYSFLLIATGFNLHLLAVIQNLMAVTLTIIIFLIFRELARSEPVAFVSALAYALNPSLLLFEFAFLPEHVCTFLIGITAYVFIRFLDAGNSTAWWKYFLLGLLSGICLLTRPHYQFLLVLLLGFTLYRLRGAGYKRLITAGVTLLLPVTILLGSWLVFQKKRTGRMVMTTHTGITLMYHAVNFVEYAPESYTDVRDVLIKGQKEYLRKEAEYYGVVEAVIPELQSLKNLNYTQIDTLYLGMAIATIKQKPVLYLKSVVRAMARFFKPSWYSRQFGIRGVLAGERTSSKIVALIYAAVHLFLMVALVATPLILIARPYIPLRHYFSVNTSFLHALIGLTALIQAVMVLGENSRFRVSVEPYMYGFAIWSAWRLAEYAVHRRSLPGPGRPSGD